MLPGLQIRPEGSDPGSVTGRGRRLRRERRGRHDPTATRPPLRQVLDHHQLNCREVKDLPAFLTHDGSLL
jgi:hypothetical protein